MSDDKFQHTSHDLALVQDWLDAKGYGGEAKTVMDAMDLIASLRAAIAEAVAAEREACVAYLRSIHHDATADILARARGEE